MMNYFYDLPIELQDKIYRINLLLELKKLNVDIICDKNSPWLYDYTIIYKLGYKNLLPHKMNYEYKNELKLEYIKHGFTLKHTDRNDS